VCRHPERHAIDRLLATGTASFRNIAQRHGLSATAVFRHRANCLPAALVAAAGEEKVREALDVLQQLKAINQVAMRTMIDAHRSGDGDLALRAVDRVQKQIELQAKLLGELQQEGTATINVVQSPEWLQLRRQTLRALSPYTEARVAAAGALQC
jgi:hypothetical protein